MINFRRTADMFLAKPKTSLPPLPPFKDLTMPKRNWQELNQPAEARKKLNSAEWRMKIARQSRGQATG